MASAIPSIRVSSSSSSGSSWVNPTNEKYTILERHKPECTQLVMAGTDLDKDTASIVADYVADGKLMDRKGWLEYFGVEIGEESDKIKKALKFDNFYKIYHGPNPVDLMENVPVDKIRQVCESCLIPVVRPETVEHNGFSEDFCLTKLEEIAEHPIKGHPAKYSSQSTAALQQHGNKKAGPSALVIMLKGVVARGKSWSNESQNLQERGQIQYLQDLNDKTGFGCKIPDALSQIAILFAHHAVTGERPMGDSTGVEGAWTYGRTDELVRYEQNSYHMLSGGFRNVDSVGAAAPAVLGVSGSVIDVESDGVGVLRES